MDIVIYEDDFLTRTLLEEWLGEAGYRVREGARREPERVSRADLVIVSVRMPKLAGARCIKDIGAAHPGTPLLAISGQFRPGLAAAGTTASALGVQKVMAKPLVRCQLLEAVRDIIGTRA